MSKQTWTVEALTDHYYGMGDVNGAHMQKVLDWVVANDRFIESEAKAALFSIAGHGGERVFAVFSSGHVYVWLQPHRFQGGEAERDQLVEDLKERGLQEPGFDVTAVKEGKTMSRRLGDLSDDEVEDLIALMARY